MKKIVAIALTLAMVLAMVCTASAEIRTFVMTYVTDLEDNEISGEGMPVLVFGADNETKECSFGTTEETKTGTFEVLGEEDGVTYIAVTIEGETIEMGYVEAEDYFFYVDETNGFVYYLTRYEAEAAE